MQYIPRSIKAFCDVLKKRTSVTLFVGASTWNVDVLRRKKVCRFAKGWDKFTKDNNLIAGQMITFHYIGHLTFQVAV